MGNQRKRKFIRQDIQLKVVFICLFVASLVLLINFQLSLASLWNLSNSLTSTTDLTFALEELRGAVISRFLISVVTAIPLSAAIGVLYSFRFSGPIHRFKKYFLAMNETGRWDEPLFLRKGDDLQDVCESMNNALDDMRGFLVENRELLKEIQGLHASGVLQATDEAKQSVNGLMNRIAATVATHAQRLPEWPYSAELEENTPASPVGKLEEDAVEDQRELETTT